MLQHNMSRVPPSELVSVEIDHSMIVIQPETGIVAYMELGKDKAQVRDLQLFGQGEIALLLPLLKWYPTYCPNELLYAHFYGGLLVTEEDIEQARQKLQDAFHCGTLKEQMHALRNTLSRIRLKIQPQYDIKAVNTLGYLFTVVP